MKIIPHAISQTPVAGFMLYIHLTGLSAQRRLYTVRGWRRYSYPQEENRRFNEKPNMYREPSLTFIMCCPQVEQIWYTPERKSLLSKAAQNRNKDS